MVNLIITFIVGLFITHGSPLKGHFGTDNGQFAVDQRGKFVVYKSDELPANVRFPVARARLIGFLEARGDKIVINTDNRLESTGSVTMRKHAGIGNYVAGQLHYTLVAENNDGSLNYWFTDLMYQPLRNDRYGKRIKATRFPIPLEKKVSKINERIWYKQRSFAHDTIQDLADQLSAQIKAAGQAGVITTNM
ncbi:hypothetical protein [Parapedobacter sp. DT-150]|uniref:hypothetical protein n=1 Tax=Parapedobacter sp. DT-150 TaxID=3396162 RepID=UPI003F1D41A5